MFEVMAGFEYYAPKTVAQSPEITLRGIEIDFARERHRQIRHFYAVAGVGQSREDRECPRLGRLSRTAESDAGVDVRQRAIAVL